MTSQSLPKPVPDTFYADLPSFADFSQFTRVEHYRALPADWLVIITDIRASTVAIEQGLYKEVNSVSTASVVVVLNALHPLKIPYVFGGDGATLCIPPDKLEAVKAALAASRELATSSFGLQLRVGIVPMQAILAQKHRIAVGKYQPSAYFQQAMFQGDGLRYAESLVKDDRTDNPYILPAATLAKGDFSGFECRWSEIPSSKEETVAIMVQVLGEDGAEEKATYTEIVDKITEIYGNETHHHPVHLGNLNLSLSPQRLSAETRVRTHLQSRWAKYFYLVKIWVLALVGKYLMARRIKTETVDWGAYKQNFIDNTDYRKFDETLRMVLCSTRAERTQLTHYLDSLYAQKKAVFGIHASAGAIVTCLIADHDKNHVHLLDGSNGGYAMAARQMKQRLLDMPV